MGKLIMNSFTTNPSGLTPAEQKDRYGNAIISANVNGEVYVKDCIFAKPGYNCFEIGLDSKVEPPSKVTFENCEFYNDCIIFTIILPMAIPHRQSSICPVPALQRSCCNQLSERKIQNLYPFRLSFFRCFHRNSM